MKLSSNDAYLAVEYPTYKRTIAVRDMRNVIKPVLVEFPKHIFVFRRPNLERELVFQESGDMSLVFLDPEDNIYKPPFAHSVYGTHICLGHLTVSGRIENIVLRFIDRFWTTLFFSSPMSHPFNKIIEDRKFDFDQMLKAPTNYIELFQSLKPTTFEQLRIDWDCI